MSLVLESASDLLIAVSYFLIPMQVATCLQTTTKVQVLAVVKITFVLFINCCGLTHFIAFVAVSSGPLPFLSAALKGLTAVVSVGSVIVLQLYLQEIKDLVARAAHLEAVIIESENRLEELAERNEELAQSRSRILASITHEFRNPLQGILGFAEILRGSGLKAQNQTLVDDIFKSATTLLELVNDMLDIAKVNAENFVLHMGEVAVVDEIVSVMRQAEVQIRSRVTLRYAVGEGVPKYISCDRLRFVQIMTNLLGNSAKFTFDGTISVSISTVRTVKYFEALLDATHLSGYAADSNPLVGLCEERAADRTHGKRQKGRSEQSTGSDVGWICVMVTDTGAGVPEGSQHNIFDSFEQAHSSTFGGTGLGLALCKTLIHKMHGHLSFRSKEGRGSVFGFLLPATDKSVKTERVHGWESVRSMAAMTAGLPVTHFNVPGGLFRALGRILVVDDSLANRTILSRYLKQLDVLSIVTATNGQEAVEICKKVPVAGVFMDITMPKMSGSEATATIKSMYPEVAVFAYTGHSSVPYPYRRLFDGVLRKPCSKADVAAVLACIAQRAQQSSKNTSQRDFLETPNLV